MQLLQETGTPAWDELDGSAEDSIVRSNDIITYNVALSQRGDMKSMNPYIEVTAPQGTEFTSLPPYCASGSLSPESLPAPQTPITGDSWAQLPQQTLQCFLRAQDIADSSEQNFPFEVRVRGEVPNGTDLIATATAAADAVAPAEPATATATVAAEARYDISKNGLFEVPNSIDLPLSSRTECSFGEPGRQCLWTYYTLMMSVPNGGKGNTPLSEFSFTDDLSPLSYYGVAMLEEEQARYGAYLMECRNAPGYVGVPKSKLGNPINSVRDSGSVNCAQPGGAGTPVTVNVTNVDTTAWTYPTKDQGGRDLPGTRAAVFAVALRVQVPVEAVTKWGTPNAAGTSFRLPMNNTLKDFAGTDISGNAIDPSFDNPDNNYRNTNFVVNTVGQVSKLFAAVPGTPGNVPAGQYEADYYWQGPASVSRTHSGDGQIFPGQNVYSAIYMRNGTSPELTKEPLTIGTCDSWDNTLLHLQAKNYPSGSGRANTFGSDGEAVWIGGGFMPAAPGATSSIVTDKSVLPELKVLYSNAATGGPGFDCKGVTDWYEDPAEVPGNAADLVADGVYTGVNVVRLVAELPTNIGNSAILINIGMRAADDLKPGTFVPNYRSSVVFPRGGVTDVDLAAARWELSQFDKETNTGGNGDRLVASELISHLNKEIKAADGNFTSNITEVASGDTYTFKLTPNLNAGATEGTSPKVIVEDCLPAGQIIEDSSHPYLTSRQPDSTLDCSSGTYLYWDLGALTTSEKLDPIIYDVRISNVIDAGTYDNIARIGAVGDSSAAEKRTDLQQVRVINPAGVKIEKSPASRQTEVNRDADQANNYQVQWDITSANIGQYPGVANIDMIDVLPKNAHDPLAGTEFSKGESEFTGTLELASIEKLQGTRSEIWYSTLDQEQLSTDPKDPSNSTIGDAEASGPLIPDPATWTQTPPADMSTVTAVRVKHDGAFESADNFTYRMVFTPHGNVSGDRYVNAVYAMATVLTASGGFVEFRNLGPIASVVDVIGGSIGDRVWYDTNGNGVQDEGEDPAPGIPVKLTGSDALGNAISLETETDADGNYLFENLHSSNDAGYTIEFVAPDGEYFTVQSAGADGEIDSEASQLDGRVTGVRLAAGEERRDIDAGLLTAGIELVKSADPASGLRAGDKVSYTFKATNTGSMVLENVTLSEDSFVNAAGDQLTLDSAAVLDAAASTGTPEALRTGETLVWAATYTVTELDVSVGDYLDNVASVAGNGVTENQNPPVVTDEDDERVTLVPAEPGIELVKSAEPVRNLSTGDTVNYTFTATNTGDVTLTNIVLREQAFANAAGDALVLDAPPALDTTASTGTNETLNPGEKLVWTASYTVTEVDVATMGPISNTALVEGTPPGDGTPVTDEDDERVHPKGVPGIEIVKYVNDDDANDAPGVRIPAGQDAEFRYVVTNTGNTALVDVVVVDDQGVRVTFPAGFDGSLEPGETVEGHGTDSIPEGAYVNIGTVTGAPVDAEGNPALDENDEPITQVTDEDPAHAFGAAASYTILKEVQDADGEWRTGDDRPTLKPGTEARWRVTVTNTGNVEIDGLVITDEAVPAGSSTIARLEAGDSVSWEFTSTVGEGQLENVVTATLESPFCQEDCEQDSTAGYGTEADPADPAMPVTGATIWSGVGLGTLLLGAGALLLLVRRRRTGAVS